jgi:uncharacterized protein
MTPTRIEVDHESLAAFCRTHHIPKLSFFGSVTRPDFRPESDVDVLVTFEDDARWSLLDFAQAKLELEDLFGRKVDLVEKKTLVNPFRRHSILKTKQVLYGDSGK